MRDFHSAQTVCNSPAAAKQPYAITASCQRGHTVTFSCQSAVTATHTGASPHHAAVHDADHQCRSEQQYMIKKHVLQVGPVLNEHPNPRTGSPSTWGTTTPSDTRSENRDCVEIDTTANTQYTHHITNGGDVSDSHLVYSVPLTAIFIK